MSSRPTRGAARLAAILDALPDALLLVNGNGTVVDANSAAVESLQTPGTSLVGMGVLGLLPEFDPSRIPGSMRPAPSDQQGADRPVRMTARRTDGSTFPVEVTSSDFEDEGSSYSLSTLTPYDPYRGGAPGWAPPGYQANGSAASGSSARELLLVRVRDLSDRLDVEAELRRQHKQTEMILRAAAEGIVGVDLEGRVVLVNPAAAHILGFRASELGGRELHPLVQHSRPDGTPLAAEESALSDTLTSGRKHRVRGTALWRKDGRPVTVDLTTAPVRDGDQLVGAVMTFTDRTRELALVARNEHLTAVLEEELRGPLDRLRDRIDSLAADPAGQLWPEANWTLRRIADECARFSRLVDGVLSYQRFEVAAERGKEALDRKPVSLDKVVQRAIVAARELVGTQRLRFSLHAAPVEVVADAERLGQALAHLVADVGGVTPGTDAIGPAPRPAPASYPGGPAVPPAAAEEAPMVVIAAAQRGAVARIEVRGASAGGSPVHLPIARGVVERHGGVLQSHELPDGKGTTYVVELPLDPAAARAAAERAGAAGRRDTAKESDTAVLPELPDAIPELPAARRSEENGQDGPAQQDGPADGGGRSRRGGHAAGRDSEREAVALPESHGPIALGPGPTGRQSAEDAAVSAVPAVPVPAAAGEPHPPRQPQPQPQPVPENDAQIGQADSAAVEPAGQEQRSRRRRAAAPETEAGFPGAAVYPGLEHALPPSPGTPAHGTPSTGPADHGASAQETPAQGTSMPTGRRRRLAVPPGEDPGFPAQQPAEPPTPEPAAPAALPSAAHDGRDDRDSAQQQLQPQPQAGLPARSGLPQLPVRQSGANATGSAALEPARPEPAAGAFPNPFAGNFVTGYPGPVPVHAPAPAPSPQPDGRVATGPDRPELQVGEAGQGQSRPPGGGARAIEAAPAVPGPQTPPYPITVPPLSGTDDTDGAGRSMTGPPPSIERVPESAATAGPDSADPSGAGAQSVATADGRPRRLLVWPEPDFSTKQALKDRGYRPVIVRSREEVDAQVAAYPVALFVDPLTGPITRTALQSLRTAAVNARVPVLVTAGLGQATREAVYGADPAVLLRALSPRDSESHAPRVLLVEEDVDIATAFSAGLERRGMHVEHATSESDAVSRASSVQPNLVVMDLMLIRRRRVGIVDWLRANDRLYRTPMVIYTSVDIDRQELPRLRTGETVLFLAERSTSEDVQSRIVDLLGKIGSPTAEEH